MAVIDVDFDPDLKPCPFCGSRDIDYGGDWIGIECRSCGASGPYRNDKTTCVEIWNRRPFERDRSQGSDA